MVELDAEFNFLSTGTIFSRDHRAKNVIFYPNTGFVGLFSYYTLCRYTSKFIWRQLVLVWNRTSRALPIPHFKHLIWAFHWQPVFESKISFFAWWSVLKLAPFDRKLNSASNTNILPVKTNRQANLDKVYYQNRIEHPVFEPKTLFFARWTLLKMMPVDRKSNSASNTII
jgi:hypothetical protein